MGEIEHEQNNGGLPFRGERVEVPPLMKKEKSQTSSHHGGKGNKSGGTKSACPFKQEKLTVSSKPRTDPKLKFYRRRLPSAWEWCTDVYDNIKNKLTAHEPEDGPSAEWKPEYEKRSQWEIEHEQNNGGIPFRGERTEDVPPEDGPGTEWKPDRKHEAGLSAEKFMRYMKNGGRTRRRVMERLARMTADDSDTV